MYYTDLSFISKYAISVSASYIKICKKNDPDLAKCIINSVYSLKPKLVEGIPELDVPSIEPLPLERVELRNGQSTSKIDANITNIQVWGPSSFEILELKPNVAKNRFAFKISIPHLYFEGDYDIDINFLLLKYKGQGKISGNFTDYKSSVLMKGHLIKLDGQNHLEFDKFRINLVLGKNYFYLDNLFSQDVALHRATNDVVNENADLFANEVRPAIENALSDIFTKIANTITKRFTYDELFPAT
ncbi:hypothetical protein NQ318_010242 [Aromia moschata]|uniref:Protein takeout n=1 Tax=Aromia moschata TaxID=1265417 RepID=A0AAV8YKL1_9CUCU|nr:hypothetical protein NQ318_010242 [Aromia moschata]